MSTPIFLFLPAILGIFAVLVVLAKTTADHYPEYEHILNKFVRATFFLALLSLGTWLSYVIIKVLP